MSLVRVSGLATVAALVFLAPTGRLAAQSDDIAGTKSVPPAVVGQVVSAGSYCDGVAVPSGTTLLSPAVVRTGGRPAILHLTDGSVMALLPQSEVKFEISGVGRLEVAVEAGRLAYADRSGKVVELGQSERAVRMFALLQTLGTEDPVGEGISPAEVGTGIGAVALGAYVLDEIDEEERPASLVTP